MCTEISNHENNKEMGWPEKGGFCIKCDRGGGKVLVCSDSNCPIVVHEECMGCPAKFDDRGNFYCPYCLYRQATVESCKAREDAMLKKQALSRFLDNEVTIGDKVVQPSTGKSPSKRADKSSPEVTIGDKLVQPSMGKSPSKRADKSSPEERTGFLQSKCNKVGEGMQTEHEPEVDNQQIDRDVEDRQEDGHSSEIPEREKKTRRDFENHQEDGHLREIPEREKKTRKKAKQMRAENETEVDDQQLDRGVEDHKKDDHLSEIPEREKKIRRKAKRVLAENEPEADDQQLDRDFEDHQEDGDLSEIPEREKKTRKKAKQMRAENETEVDDLQLERGVEDHKKDDHLAETPDRGKKIRKKANQMLAENEPVVDDQLLDRDVEDCQGDGHLREIPEREENITKKAAQMQAGGKENEDGGGAKADQMQGKARESAASFMNEEPESQLHLKAKRRVETGASTFREFEAVLRRSNHNMIKKPDRKKKIRAKAKLMLAENEPEVDDQLLDRDAEDCHPIEIPVREKNSMKKAAVQMKAGRKENEAGGGAEAEQMQGGESAVPFANEEPESQLRMKAKRRDETRASTSREFEAVLGRRNRNTETNEIEGQPSNLDSERSSRTTFSPKKVSGLTGETSSPDKSKQAEPWQRNQFPNGRRQKLMWSTEEEEMLEEGVHKFSATANKNIPWRKILDFGRHVFHPTRMPTDLKDKWRTLCFR
ncbi:zinc finger CCCH domain-containing protein 13-like isoform X2 [Ipomoea triloba]|uniref:zinc finger CCCH domain-containing protein 13-like isoform X2 n=1 Tax=Ipomoea triloba TaxID=35885 RepID=UPI00125E55DA|nr:zinc finger CCCH domain-containing protein 13-like isoform X2 [Ipomoea triloba]